MLMLNSYHIYNWEAYRHNVDKYLQFPTFEKLLICDFLNYFIYTKVGDNEEGLDAIAYVSILIKIKYYMLRRELENLDKEMIDYGKRIYENIQQLGNCSKNKYLNNHFKEIFDYKGQIPTTNSSNTPGKEQVVQKSEVMKPKPQQPIQKPAENVFNI
jgi:hypothetical protein